MDEFYIDDYKRIWGNQSINGDIIITDQNNNFIVETSDGIYDITISPGTYKTEFTTNYSELIDELVSKVTLSSFPIEISLGGYHKDQKYNIVVVEAIGDKDIIDISGTFFDEYFK